MVCRASVSFRIVAAVEGLEVQLGDDLRYEPHEMILGQPVPYVGGKKKELIPVAVFEVIGHDDPPRQSRSDLQLLDCTVFRAVNNPFKNWFCNRLIGLCFYKRTFLKALDSNFCRSSINSLKFSRGSATSGM